MVDVVMVGTGEYTTGYVGGDKADSDKGCGVVALVMFDLRRRGKPSPSGGVKALPYLPPSPVPWCAFPLPTLPTCQ